MPNYVLYIEDNREGFEGFIAVNPLGGQPGELDTQIVDTLREAQRFSDYKEVIGARDRLADDPSQRVFILTIISEPQR